MLQFSINSNKVSGSLYCSLFGELIGLSMSFLFGFLTELAIWQIRCIDAVRSICQLQSAVHRLLNIVGSLGI